MERRDEGPEASARTVLQVAADATPGSPQTNLWPELVTAGRRRPLFVRRP